LELARGTLTAGLERNVRTTGAGDTTLQTVARLGLRTQINTTSGLDFNVNYARVTDLNNPADDISRGVFSATYNHDVTRDWALNLGLSHTREKDASSNMVFMSLGRKTTVRW
jgi:hypothetical protein